MQAAGEEVAKGVERVGQAGEAIDGIVEAVAYVTDQIGDIADRSADQSQSVIEMRNAMLISALLWALLLWLIFPSYQYHAVWLAMNAFMLLRGILLGLAYPRIERAIRPVAAT